jgi:hypothetical protein
MTIFETQPFFATRAYATPVLRSASIKIWSQRMSLVERRKSLGVLEAQHKFLGPSYSAAAIPVHLKPRSVNLSFKIKKG